MTEQTIMSRHFARERTLMYAMLWHESDYGAFHNWIGSEIKNVIFLHSGKDSKISVWYSDEEYEKIGKLLGEKVNEDPEFFNKVQKEWNKKWELVLPYLKEEKTFSSPIEYNEFYKNIVKWWSVMNLCFILPNVPNIKEEIINKCMELRAKSEKHSDNIDKLFKSYIIETKPEYKDIAPVLMPEEAYSLTKGELSNNEIESIRKRLINGCFIFNGKVFLMDELNNILKENNAKLEEIDGEEIKEFKGTIACKGNATGKARIISSENDLKDFQEGEILVAEMTQPKYLPIMKKAIAFITDEGGATCHAAIVARELNKPCIIGTKHATQILKTGDEVEIDANKGVITKIK